MPSLSLSPQYNYWHTLRSSALLTTHFHLLTSRNTDDRVSTVLRYHQGSVLASSLRSVVAITTWPAGRFSLLLPKDTSSTRRSCNAANTSQSTTLGRLQAQFFARSVLLLMPSERAILTQLMRCPCGALGATTLPAISSL